ncbi:ATP-binding protein [Streptomyces sp. H10-C2]|uniref:ATP-binding protein n=1 Tax=unclassified Streptomyces TaxID=2593676 RepID=UPI0024B8CDAA|nr:MULTISPECIES: ATP-binding protein [unclassified Streptomyces]MDJ0345850.1 ATP-binding protein [Streptomyces sp. PH10-H1]MDJ0371184.1 ATP-binding protein [Streptomyces sp. H10-C2]
MLTALARPASASASAPASAPAPAGTAGTNRASGFPRPPSAGRTFVAWAPRPTAAVVPRIRTCTRAVLEGWRVSGAAVDTLLLAVSELVANAVQHAGAVTDRLCVTVSFGGGWLQLDVADGDPALPRFAGPEADPDDESGRGLMIVGLLVAEAGGEVAVIPRDRGKAVRVRIPAP